MEKIVPDYRICLIYKLKNTSKPFAKKISTMLEIHNISNLEIESLLVDCVIALEKLLEEKNKQISILLAHSDFDN